MKLTVKEIMKRITEALAKKKTRRRAELRETPERNSNR